MPSPMPEYLNVHYICESASRLLFLSMHWARSIPAFSALGWDIVLPRESQNMPRTCTRGKILPACSGCRRFSKYTFLWHHKPMCAFMPSQLLFEMLDRCIEKNKYILAVACNRTHHFTFCLSTVLLSVLITLCVCSQEANTSLVRACWNELFTLGLAQCAHVMNLSTILTAIINHLQSSIQNGTTYSTGLSEGLQNNCPW